jgi:hypothetical protein
MVLEAPIYMDNKGYGNLCIQEYSNQRSRNKLSLFSHNYLCMDKARGSGLRLGDYFQNHFWIIHT